MKKAIFILMVTLVAPFQNVFGQAPSKGKPVVANYKYHIRINNQTNIDTILERNKQLDEIISTGNNRGWKDLGNAILNSYKSSLTQKTVNATSNLIGLGVSYITTLVQKNSKDFESWSKAKQEQCIHKRTLSSEEQIDDFYYLPSTNGALDPRDLKFNGFSCHKFLETAGSAETRMGHEVFYVSCKLRSDSLGACRMANHSKFMLEIDSLIFYPKYCNLPNIPNKDFKQKDDIFDYSKLTNLVLEMKVKVVSSWINEAVILNKNQELGEFTITAKIDKKELTIDNNGDSVFVFNKNNPRHLELVTIIGESFIVPRSFYGSSSNPSWGTGQYNLLIDVTESCQLNAKYYNIKNIGNAEAVNFANLPGYEKWDKKIWKEEWKQMKTRKEGDSFWGNAWKSIKTAYIGNDWVKELVDPAATMIYQHETQALYNLLDFDATSASGSSTNASKQSSGNSNTYKK